MPHSAAAYSSATTSLPAAASQRCRQPCWCSLLHEHARIPDTAGVPELRPCAETLSPLQSVDRSITLAATRRNRLKGMRRRCAKLLARMARRAEELAAGAGGQQGAGTRGGESGQRPALPAARDGPALDADASSEAARGGSAAHAAATAAGAASAAAEGVQLVQAASSPAAASDGAADRSTASFDTGGDTEPGQTAISSAKAAQAAISHAAFRCVEAAQAAASPTAVVGTDAVGGASLGSAAAAPAALSVEAAAVLSKLMRIRRTLEKLQACNNVAGQPTCSCAPLEEYLLVPESLQTCERWGVNAEVGKIPGTASCCSPLLSS